MTFLSFKKLATFSFIIFFAQSSYSSDHVTIETCGVAHDNNAARSEAWNNATCPSGYIKDESRNFLCSTLPESLDRQIPGQNCTVSSGSVLILCNIRCFKDSLVDNVLRVIFPPNEPNDIGVGGSRQHGCVNIGGVLTCD